MGDISLFLFPTIQFKSFLVRHISIDSIIRVFIEQTSHCPGDGVAWVYGSGHVKKAFTFSVTPIQTAHHPVHEKYWHHTLVQGECLFEALVTLVQI